MAKPIKQPCAPRIWKKFNEEEKEYWILFYDAFNLDTNLPTGYRGKISPGELEVIAHNMACQAVWELQRRAKKLAEKTNTAPRKRTNRTAA